MRGAFFIVFVPSALFRQKKNNVNIQSIGGKI